MKVKTVIIPAAGFGTRFLPWVKEVPKEMLPLVNKPIIQHVVEECLSAGLENIVIVVREGNNIVENYFKKPTPEVYDLLLSVGKESRFREVSEVLSYKEVKIIKQRTDLPYGNGSPVLSAMSEVPQGEPFAVCFADDLVLSEKSGIGQLLEYFEYNEIDGVIGAQEVDKSKVNRYGIIKPKEVVDEKHGQVEYIVEKPSADNSPSNLVTYGRYVLPYKVMEVLSEVNVGLDQELWLPDANHRVAQSHKIMYKVIDGEWYTTGDPLNYYEALTRFYLAHQEYSDKIRDIISNLPA